MPSNRQDQSSTVAPISVAPTAPVSHSAQPQEAVQPVEIGGREGPEPTRFGDWEKRGRCIDF